MALLVIAIFIRSPPSSIANCGVSNEEHQIALSRFSIKGEYDGCPNPRQEDSVASKTRQRKSVDETLVKVVAHPLRVQALSVLTERPASPKELAAELDAPVGNVSYHVRELEAVGLIELVDEQKRRGAVEHFYRAITRPMLSADEWQKLSLEDRQRFSAWIIQLLLADATQALAAGTFDARSDRYLSRTPLLVDVEGWRELVEIHATALKATLEVQAASVERLTRADGEEEGIPTIAALTFFEMPPKRRSPDAD
jgi:DNA-binding transcriptional ArsR family regulator